MGLNVKKIVTQKVSAYEMTRIQLISCGIFFFGAGLNSHSYLMIVGDATLNLKKQSFFQSIYIREKKLYPLRQEILWQV